MAVRTKKHHANGKPPAPPETLSPEASLPDPGDRGPNVLVIPTRQAGVRVNEDTALTLGAVYACVKVITEDLAKLPWRVFRKRDDGGREPFPGTVDWLIHTQANPETPAFQFRETILAHALTWGNGYAEIERDAAGRPVWMWPITPDRVTPFRYAGRILYAVSNPREADTYLEADDVYHLRGLGFDGLVGYSIIQLAARTVAAGIATDDAVGTLFANDSTPGGILQHPGRLTDPARKNLVESWERRHAGPTNRRRVAIIEEGMTWQQTGLPPEDVQLVQQRGMTPSEICRWFRVAPHKIADLTRATFSNIEEQEISHAGDALHPWARRLESEADIKLFGRTQRGTLFTRINFNGLLRGKAVERSAFYNAMLDRGVFSINDVRELEDMNPIGKDGDKRFVPLNMQLLSTAGDQPDASPGPSDQPPGPPDAPPDQPPDMPPADMPNATSRLESVCMPVIEQACERVIKRAADRARKMKGGEAESVAADFKDYGAKMLTPPARMLAEIYSPKSDAAAGVAVGLLLERPSYPVSAAEWANELRELVKAAAAAGGK